VQQDAAAICGEQEGGHIFIYRRTVEEAEPAAFREDDRKVGQAAEHPEAAAFYSM
jgi:hypothetical protein